MPDGLTSASEKQIFSHFLPFGVCSTRCVKDKIQDLLDDNEYTTNVEVTEEYIDSDKLALLKAKREIENRLVSTGEKPNLRESPPPRRNFGLR
jgi:hypothetical protein